MHEKRIEEACKKHEHAAQRQDKCRKRQDHAGKSVRKSGMLEKGGKQLGRKRKIHEKYMNIQKKCMINAETVVKS